MFEQKLRQAVLSLCRVSVETQGETRWDRPRRQFATECDAFFQAADQVCKQRIDADPIRFRRSASVPGLRVHDLLMYTYRVHVVLMYIKGIFLQVGIACCLRDICVANAWSNRGPPVVACRT